MRRAAVLALSLAVVAVAAPAVAQDDPAPIRVGITLPLAGDELATTGPIRDAALLALASAALPAGAIEPVILDHAVNGAHDADKAAADMEALIDDPTVVAAIGPYNSSMAQVQIPLGNAAGLLQCSPSTTIPGLTRGDAALALRAAAPGRIAFVRTVASDDVQVPAMADYVFANLGVRRIAVLDDGETYGREAADRFASRWAELGGTVTGRERSEPGTADYGPALERLAAGSPEAVYFGGLPSTGASLVRRQMADAGMGDLPYIVAEGANDGSADVAGSFLATTGDAVGDTWTSAAAPHDYPGKDAFTAAYRTAYGSDPTAYAITAYACAEVIAAAIADAVASGDPSRESVRAAVADPARTWETILGPTSFDGNGDIVQQRVSIFRSDPAMDADPSGAGRGDFVFVDEVGAPAP